MTQCKKTMISGTMLACIMIVIAGCEMDARPVALLDIHVAEGEQVALEEFLQSFAERHGFSMRDSSRPSALAGGRRVSSFRFNRRDGLEIGMGDYLDGKRFWIAIYDNTLNDWDALFYDLYRELISRWPSTVINLGPADAALPEDYGNRPG